MTYFLTHISLSTIPFLLDLKYINEQMINGDGETALVLAVNQNYSECIKLILSNGGKIYDDKEKLLPITAADYKNFLDDQIKIDSSDPNYVIFDYSKITLENMEKELQQLHDLTHISRDHKQFITHPLIENLLMMKWRTIEPYWLAYVLMKLFTMLIFIALGVGSSGGLHQSYCQSAIPLEYSCGAINISLLSHDNSTVIETWYCLNPTLQDVLRQGTC